MIVYHNTKASFQADVEGGGIEDIIREKVLSTAQINVSPSEISSWSNSLTRMFIILNDSGIPDDCHVSIEYKIPQTSKRIDFIITGQDESRKDHVIIIELKQWTSCEVTDKDAIVVTKLQGRDTEVSHPSYQAWSYAALLNGFNEAVYQDAITLMPCAYLHNFKDKGTIDHPFYADYIQKAPLFLSKDTEELRAFIKQYIRYGDSSRIMYRIENGKIRPSKDLANSLASMIKGKQEFVLIDDQKIVYETALHLTRKASAKSKSVLIVEGGPGTGKTVVAINLLVAITKLGLLTQYVSKNSAPRAVYESKLTGTMRRSVFSNLFKGSGSYVSARENEFDALIVDEAHRLNEKSGLYANLGENQIKEIIQASKCSIFFIDEDQRVTLKDIGRKEEIRQWAASQNAKVYETNLASQFRCGGSDGYLSWLDHTLQIRETANEILEDDSYEFKVVDDPNQLAALIEEKNKINNKARMVAGYCWDWRSKKNPDQYDIIIPEANFKRKWNLASYGSLWLIDPNSVSEIGCIHTCQGLELDYIGVIIGPDLIVRKGRVLTDASKRSFMDASIKGYKAQLKEDKLGTLATLDTIIKNTYRTLMTRGMKGCYLYCTDPETAAYFKNHLAYYRQSDASHASSMAADEGPL